MTERAFGVMAEQLQETCLQSPFASADTIVRAASAQLQEEGVDALDAILAACKQAYEAYVAPFDIPGVPNFIEPLVDAKIWEGIELAVRAFAEKLTAE